MIFSMVLLMLPGKLLDFVAAGFLFIRVFRVEQWIDALRDRMMTFMQVYNVNSLLINPHKSTRSRKVNFVPYRLYLLLNRRHFQ